MPEVGYLEILEEIKTVLGRFAKTPIPIKAETELVEELGLDSIGVMQVVEAIEDTFDISFPLNNLSEIRNVRDFALQIQKQIGDG